MAFLYSSFNRLAWDFVGQRGALIFMITKHFFRTLFVFTGMIILGLIGVFLVDNFSMCEFDGSCYIGQAVTLLN